MTIKAINKSVYARVQSGHRVVLPIDMVKDFSISDGDMVYLNIVGTFNDNDNPAAFASVNFISSKGMGEIR